MDTLNYRTKCERLVGPALGAVALAVYLTTLSRGAFPGLPAALTTQVAGLMPTWVPTHPVWRLCATAVARIAGGDAALWLGVFSALCGAAAVSLLYGIMKDVVRLATEEPGHNERDAGLAGILAGTGSALFLAFSIPFWMVSTRTHQATFHILLLLLMTRFFINVLLAESKRRLLVFALLYGVCTVEYHGFIPLSLLFGGYIILWLWRREELRPLYLVQLALMTLVGLCLYLVTAGIFMGSEGYVCGGYEGLWEVLRGVLRSQYASLVKSLPKQGWLVIVCVTMVPWLAALSVAHRALNDEREWGFYILHTVITLLVGLVLLNSPLSPWVIVGRTRDLVSPYLLSAMVFGYVLAYWYLLPCGIADTLESHGAKSVVRKLGWIIIVPGLVLCLMAPFRNLSDADGRSSRVFNDYAMDVVESLEGREWLLTGSGIVDAHIRLAAHKAGVPVRVVNVRGGQNPYYRNYIASLFDEVRYKNLLTVGLVPMLQEWMENDPEIADKLAVLDIPDMWAGIGCTAVPHKTLFLGARPGEEFDMRELVTAHESFWVDAIQTFSGKTGDPLQDSMREYVARHLSLVANNLGVLCEERGSKEGALLAYGKARELDEKNISTLLNLAVMLEQGYMLDEAETVQAEVETLISKMSSAQELWALSRRYGYVRSPNAYVDRGWNWVLSGQPGIAAAGIQKAMDLVPAEKRGRLRSALAGLYLNQSRGEESQALFYETLVEDPNDHEALLGLVRLSIQSGSIEESEKLLQRAAAAGVDKMQLAMQWAALHTVAGRPAEARVVLEEIVELDPDSLQAWALLGGVQLTQGDDRGVKRTLSQMRRLEGEHGYYQAVTTAALHERDGAWADAEQAYRKAGRFQPNNVSVLEKRLRLNVILGRKEDASRLVSSILRLDRNHALANYVAGSIQIAKGDYALAEDSLRRSLKTRATPEGLNDLAWVLQEQGSFAEAEAYARKALEMAPKKSTAWDTLGYVLMKTDRLAEAEKALAKSLELMGDNLSVHLHMAELHLLMGDKARARDELSSLSKQRGRLSVDDREQLDALLAQVGM